MGEKGKSIEEEREEFSRALDDILEINPEEVGPFLDEEDRRKSAKAIEKLRKLVIESGGEVD